MRLHSRLFLILFVGLVVLPPASARADIAPPKTPPGSTLLPADGGTRVRMMAETVTLAIRQDPRDATAAIAETHAAFVMRNLGPVEERMAARFPLSFFDGRSDGWFEFPEIPSVQVKVDGRSVSTRRELQPPLAEADAYRERDEIPWAVFDVTFPVGRDVAVDVFYTVRGYGYYPQISFEYVLETGAGWNDTIGAANIVVQLPYQAEAANVYIEDSALSSLTSPGASLIGNEVRWHFEDLEPTRDDNIVVELVAPQLWQTILKEQESVARNPADGEAWGRLGKAYKEAARLPKGWLRDDSAGLELLVRSNEAYQRCLTLLPRDSLWHYGYADLLWSEYYWNVRASGLPDPQALLPTALSELKSALELDPSNAPAQDLLTEISMAVEGAVEQVDGKYVFLALTATPPPPTPYLAPATATGVPLTVPSTATALPSPAPTAFPVGGNPLCGAAALSLLLPVAAFFWRRHTSFR